MNLDEKKLGLKKQINISKRGYILYLEHTRIIVFNKTVSYIKKEEKEELYYNIPYLNTSVLILGSGTSISNEAARLLAEGNVLIMFVNTKYKQSLISDISFLPFLPSSEYKENKYNVEFAKIFLDDELRLKKAIKLMEIRLNNNKKYFTIYNNDKYIEDDLLVNLISLNDTYIERFNKADSVNNLLLIEANYTKAIYREFAQFYNIKFKRDHEYKMNEKDIKDFNDIVNNNLTDINYIKYGMAASALSAMGVNFGFPILHGKTRRGGLVYDIADLYKDSFSVTFAFYLGLNGFDRKESRIFCLNAIDKYKLFDKYFENIIEVLK